MKTDKNAAKTIKGLTNTLNRYRDMYYNNNISVITDFEYDVLFDRLKKLETETGIIMSNSPTQTVGYEVKSKLKKVQHSHPMLSLDKTKSVDDLKKFANGHECILMPKMDGLTVLITLDKASDDSDFNNGSTLVQAETRGNAIEGEDITHNAKVFRNIPLTAAHEGTLEVEGEAIITADDFASINDTLPDENKYKTPRNLVSGSVRQLDSRIAAERHIKFIAWKVPTAVNGLNTMSGRLEYVKNLGFDIVPYIIIKDDETEYTQYIECLKQIAKEQGFPIDGLVMSYNDISYGASLGSTGHHPKHSIAFKFYDEEEVTTVQDIEWTMGKTGVLTPTLVFDTVDIDGTTVNRASLHNVSIVKALQIGMGDTVTVYKANQIIPQVRENLTRSNTYKIPNICPICGQQTMIVKEKETEILVCNNIDCKGKLLGKLTHFVSQNAVNVEGLSEKTLERFIELGMVQSFGDIYRLENCKDKLYQLDGFKEKAVNKLLANIEKSRDITLDRFLYALCIPLIGKSASKDIAMACNNGDLQTFISVMDHADNDVFTHLEGFGKEMSSSLMQWWKEHKEFFTNLTNEFRFESTEAENSAVLADRTFVITGSLNHYTNRDELIAVIEKNGGKVTGSVSKKTHYLINNDIESVSGKNAKAKQLGIPIITEEQFIQMLKNNVV